MFFMALLQRHSNFNLGLEFLGVLSKPIAGKISCGYITIIVGFLLLASLF